MKKLLQNRNPSFRFISRLGRPISFPLRGAAMMALVLTASAAHASLATPPVATSAQQEISRAVTQQAIKVLHDYAAQQGWKDEKIKLTLFIPPTAAAYPLCVQPLKVSVPDNAGFQLSHQRYDVACDKSWSLTVNVRPDITLPVVMAQTDIARGTTLSESNLTLRRYNISSGNTKFMTDLSQVLGKQTRSQLRTTKPITPQQLEMPLLVKRGDEVTIDIQVEGINARTKGLAMKNGHQGEVISVRNESSNQVVKGKVQADGSIMINGPVANL
jgi:flagella basal body P-ring formation protein FlgA